MDSFVFMSPSYHFFFLSVIFFIKKSTWARKTEQKNTKSYTEEMESVKVYVNVHARKAKNTVF